MTTDKEKALEQFSIEAIRQSAHQSALDNCMRGVDMLADILVAQPELYNFRYLIETARHKSKFALVETYKQRGLINANVKKN